MSNKAIEKHIVLDKELRRDIDAIIQRLKETSVLQKGQKANDPDMRVSVERSTAITKLQEARMWLGQDLNAISEENPGKFAPAYPNGNDASTTVIDPATDKGVDGAPQA